MSSRDQAAAAILARLAMACDGALLGITLAVVAAQTWAKYRFSSHALEEVRHAPSLRISDLRSLLSSSSSSDEPGSSSSSDEPGSSSSSDEPGSSSSSSSSSDGKLVVIRGVIREKWSQGSSGDTKALISHGSGERAVVIQRTQTCLYNEWRGFFGWSLDLHALFAKSRKEQHSYSCRSVPFFLVEGGSCIVHVKLDGSTQPVPLTTVYHQLLPVQAFSSSFLQAIFGNGYPVAILDEEKILPVGKEITAIGVCKLQDGTLEIKSSEKLPCFLCDLTRDEVEANLSFNANVLFWSGILLGSLSVGILGYAIVRNWWRWKEWRRGRLQSDDASGNANTEQNNAEDEDELPDGQLCVVCLARRRTYAFTPCGHLVCCPRCAMMVERETSPKCPLCRQTIRSSIRIYAS